MLILHDWVTEAGGVNVQRKDTTTWTYDTQSACLFPVATIHFLIDSMSEPRTASIPTAIIFQVIRSDSSALIYYANYSNLTEGVHSRESSQVDNYLQFWSRNQNFGKNIQILINCIDYCKKNNPLQRSTSRAFL